MKMKFYQDLQNALLTVSNVTNNEITAEYQFSNSNNVFLGHFQGNPILPGVMQIEMTKNAIEKSTKKSYRIQSIKKTKFSAEIKPEDKITIQIALDYSDDCLNIKAVLTKNNKPAGKSNFSLIEV